MNRPPETFVSVQEDRLLAFSTACFERAGLSHDHAALISACSSTQTFVGCGLTARGRSMVIVAALKTEI